MCRSLTLHSMLVRARVQRHEDLIVLSFKTDMMQQLVYDTTDVRSCTSVLLDVLVHDT